MHIFRKATAADASAIAELYRELVTRSSVSVLPERISKIAQDENTYLIVCDQDGDIIATALVTLCADVMFNHQPFAVLENIVVSKTFQREGIGKSLLDHIEKFCVERDCSKIMLLCGSDNQHAQDFYAAMGYDSNVKSGFMKYRRYFNTR
jgi:ribosomal protein S18 acetylase RimI-like enzyme